MADAVAAEKLADPQTGQLFVVSMSYVDRFINVRCAATAPSTRSCPLRRQLPLAAHRRPRPPQAYPEVLRKYKSSHIDPLRAKKATAAVRDAWFHLVRSTVVELHAQGHIPWASFNAIPAANKYNYDEEAKDYNSERPKPRTLTPAACRTHHRSQTCLHPASPVAPCRGAAQGRGRCGAHARRHASRGGDHVRRQRAVPRHRRAHDVRKRRGAATLRRPLTAVDHCRAARDHVGRAREH